MLQTNKCKEMHKINTLEGSCDIEDWSNDAENSPVTPQE